MATMTSNRKNNKGLTKTESLYAWKVKQTGEWVLAEHHRITQWNHLQIMWVKVEVLREKIDDGMKITQTITGKYAVQYVRECLPVVEVHSVTQTNDETVMVVSWTF